MGGADRVSSLLSRPRFCRFSDCLKQRVQKKLKSSKLYSIKRTNIHLYLLPRDGTFGSIKPRVPPILHLVHKHPSRVLRILDFGRPHGSRTASRWVSIPGMLRRASMSNLVSGCQNNVFDTEGAQNHRDHEHRRPLHSKSRRGSTSPVRGRRFGTQRKRVSQILREPPRPAGGGCYRQRPRCRI